MKPYFELSFSSLDFQTGKIANRGYVFKTIKKHNTESTDFIKMIRLVFFPTIKNEKKN